MEDWKEMKEEAQKFFKDNNFHLACQKSIAAFEQLTSGKHYDKIEAVKLLSNISLMYLKLHQQENDIDKSESLFNSILYADRAINEMPSWYKGYLRLAECYSIDKKFEKVLDTLTSYLDITEDNEIPEEFQNYLNSVNYYTHTHVLEKKDIWKFVTYPDNVFVIDQKGAGHFESLDSLMRYTGFILKDLSIIVRPGIYIGTYMLHESTFEIIGDWKSKVQFDNDAIKDKPSIVFINTLLGVMSSFVENSSKMPHTFWFNKCEVTMRNICIMEYNIHHPIHAITTSNSIMNIHCSSFYSKCSAAVTFEFSTVNIENCQSIGAYSALLSSSNSICTMRNCYISNTIGIGLEMRDDSKLLRLHSCIIKNCQKQGVRVYKGAKSIQIKGCAFSNNATDVNYGEGSSVQLKGCKASIKDTIIFDRHRSAVGISINNGFGKFENLTLHNCITGFFVEAPVFVKSCIFRNCLMAVNLCEDIKGTVEFEDNSMLNCLGEIYCSNRSPQVIFHGSKSHLIYNVDNDNRTAVECEYCGLGSFMTGRTLQYCSGCKISLYCSRCCQRKAWKSHKLICARYRKTKGTTSASVNLTEVTLLGSNSHLVVVDNVGNVNETKGTTSTSVDLTEDEKWEVNDETLKVKTQAEKPSNIPEWKKKNKKKKKKKPAF